MSIKQLQDLDFSSAARIRHLPAPVSGDEPARLADLNEALEGLAWKDAVRVKAPANVNLAAPGATVDGVALSVGDAFLAADQTTTSQNGIYVWNGAGSPATRRVDASTFGELTGAVVPVVEGTSAGTQWRQTQVGGIIDSSAIAFTSFGTAAPNASETTAGISEAATQVEVDAGTPGMLFVRAETLAGWAGRAKKAQANIGDGSATQFTFPQLGSRDVLVQVVRNSAPYDSVGADVERDTTNSVVIRFASAPTSNQYRIVVIG